MARKSSWKFYLICMYMLIHAVILTQKEDRLLVYICNYMYLISSSFICGDGRSIIAFPRDQKKDKQKSCEATCRPYSSVAKQFHVISLAMLLDPHVG